MPEYRFTITEHDPDRPWLVLGRDRQTVDLDPEVSFFEWAAEHWPAPRTTRGSSRRLASRNENCSQRLPLLVALAVGLPRAGENTPWLYLQIQPRLQEITAIFPSARSNILRSSFPYARSQPSIVR